MLWRLAPFAAVLSAAVVAGCSYQLGSPLSSNDGDADQTGALHRQNAAAAPTDGALPEFDLAYARAVAAEVLGRNGKDSSVPWQNPQTGASGNITPLATSYSEGTFTCRDFLASYVRGETQDWLQGEACRTNHGKWEVKSLTPLKRN